MALHLTHRQVAASTGVAQSFMSAVTRGESFPSVILLAGLRQHHGVSLDWLLLGEGEMQQRPETTTPKHSITAPPTPVLVQLAEQASALDEVAVEHLETYMRGFLAARERQPQRARAG